MAKATSKKIAAPKKAAAKKATKVTAKTHPYFAPDFPVTDPENGELGLSLGISETRGDELEKLALDSLKAADSFGGAMKAAAAQCKAWNELYFTLFVMGDIHHKCEQMAAEQAAAEMAGFLHGLIGGSGAHVKVISVPNGHPVRTNVQAQRKDGNGKR